MTDEKRTTVEAVLSMERLGVIAKKQKDRGMLKTQGRWLWRKEWYSICSCHFQHEPDCHMCQSGTWINVHTRMVDHWFFVHFQRLWIYWASPNDKGKNDELQTR